MIPAKFDTLPSLEQAEEMLAEAQRNYELADFRWTFCVNRIRELDERIAALQATAQSAGRGPDRLIEKAIAAPDIDEALDAIQRERDLVATRETRIADATRVRNTCSSYLGDLEMVRSRAGTTAYEARL